MKTKSLMSALALVLLTACGGGTIGQPPPSHGGGGNNNDFAKVVFSVIIPSASSNGNSSKRPNYVSTNTASMSLVVDGGTAQDFALTPSTNSNCTAGGSGTTCSNLQAVAPPGTDSFQFTLYQGANETGSVLSISNVVNKVIQQGVANQLGAFTLNPVIGSISLGIAGTYTAGTSSSGNAVNISVKDPSGATIIGPGSYVTSSDTLAPVSLTSSAASFTFAVDGGSAASTGSLNTASDTATLSFNGTVGTSTIAATDSQNSAITASQVINPTAQPIVLTLASSASAADYSITTSPAELDFYESGITGTVKPSESGYAGSFTLESTTCSSADVTFSPTAGNSVTNGNSFTVSAVAAGTTGSPAICTATFKDANGQTASATFSVTTISFGLQ